MKQAVLVKIGGGLIAPKEWAEQTVDLKLIQRLVGEIKGAPNLLVVAVGSGNFGHAAVKKYGISDTESVKKVREISEKIGKIVFGEMQKQGISCKLVSPNEIWKTRNKELVKDESVLVVELLNNNIIPVLYGDVIDDETLGATIFSGEICLQKLIPVILNNGIKIKKIIQVSRELGVLGSDGKVVPEINVNNWDEVKKNVTGAVGVDVTGGMLHKVEESMEIVKKWGVETWIVGGKEPGIFEDFWQGNRQGTRISQ